MNNNIDDMIVSLEKLKLAFSEVNKNWNACDQMDNLTKPKYPFNDSFDELNLKVHNWIEDCITELKENK